jgi:hypothetical protein
MRPWNSLVGTHPVHKPNGTTSCGALHSSLHLPVTALHVCVIQIGLSLLTRRALTPALAKFCHAYKVSTAGAPRVPEHSTGGKNAGLCLHVSNTVLRGSSCSHVASQSMIKSNVPNQ